VPYDLVTSSNAIKQIFAQEWIDLYRQPWDAWTLLRRTGGKTPMSSTNTQYYTANFAVYNRFTYPDNEAVITTIIGMQQPVGNDLAATKIWIMP